MSTARAKFATSCAAGLLGLAMLSPFAVWASAVTAVTLTGTAPAVVNGPASITFSYSLSLPSGVTSAVFTTHQDAHLPATATGVLLDAVPVAPASVSAAGAGNLSVDAGSLSAGTHLLSFSAAVPGATSAATSSTLTFAYNDGTAQTINSAAVIVAINQPDLAIALTPDTGEDPGQVGPLGTGRIGALAVDVTNTGFGAPKTSLLVTLPVGLGLALPGVARDSDEEDAPLLPCAATPADPKQVVCALGAIQHTLATDDPTLFIPLITTPNPPVGTTASVRVSVAPADPTEGVDTNNVNDSVNFPIKFTGKSHLTYDIKTMDTKVAVGGTTKLTVSVRNDGPQVAGDALGLLAIESTGAQFSIVGFTGKTLTGAQADSLAVTSAQNPAAAQALAPARAARRFGRSAGASTALSSALAATAAEAKTAGPAALKSVSSPLAAAETPTDSPIELWAIGSIPIGRSVSAVVTLKAKAVGTAKLELIVGADSADPSCPNLDCTFPAITLSAVAAVPPALPVSSSTPPASTGTAQSGGGDVLADTGTQSAAQSTLAIGMLLIGTAVLLLSRRRIRPVSRHRAG